MAEEKQMDILDQEEQQASGGGGVVCQVSVHGAFQQFTSGVSPKDRTFLFTDGDSKAKAKAKAGDGAQLTACMVMYKDSVLGREVGWQDDRYITYGPPFGEDYKVFNADRNALGIALGKKVWARVSWRTSPNAEANKDDPRGFAWETTPGGEKRLKLMAYPAEVYANKAEAAKAAEGLAVAGGPVDPTYPGEHSGWTLAVWQSDGKKGAFDEYTKLIGEKKPIPVALNEVCKTYEIKTADGELDTEKLKLLLAEMAV